MEAIIMDTMKNETRSPKIEEFRSAPYDAERLGIDLSYFKLNILKYESTGIGSQKKRDLRGLIYVHKNLIFDFSSIGTFIPIIYMVNTDKVRRIKRIASDRHLDSPYVIKKLGMIRILEPRTVDKHYSDNPVYGAFWITENAKIIEYIEKYFAKIKAVVDEERVKKEEKQLKSLKEDNEKRRLFIREMSDKYAKILKK